MAETTTITRPAPIIEGSLTAFLKSIDKLGAGAVPTDFAGIDPSKYAPTIAAESQLQQDARTAAGGLGALTGPDAYKAYMSPYQQEVIDTTLSEFDRHKLLQIPLDVIKLFKLVLMVVDEKVYLQQKRQEVQQQTEQIYKHNY